MGTIPSSGPASATMRCVAAGGLCGTRGGPLGCDSDVQTLLGAGDWD